MFPAGLPMPGGRNRGKPTVSSSDQSLLAAANTQADANKNKSGPRLKSSIKDKNQASRLKTGSKVRFDPLRNNTRILSPKRKIIFDWEIQPPNDNSFDPEHDEVMAKYYGKKYKEQNQVMKHDASDDKPIKSETQKLMPKIKELDSV